MCIISSKEVFAQQSTQVVYDDYSLYQSKLLKLLKNNDRISSFTSMKALKRSSLDLKENAVVDVNYLQGSKKSLSMEKIVRIRRESVPIVWRYAQETTRPEKVTTFASAIVLTANGVCATNYHVLRSMIDTSFKLMPTDSILFVSIGEKIYPITKILSYNKTADMALFQIDPGSDPLVPFPVGNDLSAGAPVNTLTHVAGYMYSYSRGVVSRNSAADSRDPFTNRIEITADYAKGSSGGAIFDDFGNLIGMVSNTTSIYYTDNSQINLQMVVKQTVPISSILKMIIR